MSIKYLDELTRLSQKMGLYDHRCPGEVDNWVCLRRDLCTRYTPKGNMKVTNEMKQDCPGFHPFEPEAA